MDIKGLGQRLLTEEERNRLKLVGYMGKQITWLLGIGSLALSAFVLIGLANGDDTKRPEVIYAILLILNLFGFIVGPTNRQLRSLAFAALTRGTLSEGLAMPRAMGERPKSFDLGGVHVIPVSHINGLKEQTLTKAMESKGVVRIAYVGPFGPKNLQALLMAVNGTSLRKPVVCAWAARPK